MDDTTQSFLLPSLVGSRPLRARRFHGLMPHRVREVLLVSSPFDAFILEEDGLLSEKTFVEFLDISMPSAPRFTHVATGREALELLEQRRFDLVLTLTSIADMAVKDLAQAVKRKRPGRPVVLLSLDARDLRKMSESLDQEWLDGAFLWSGDSKILLAIIKYIEDRENLEHDIKQGGVQVIVLIEDSPRHYSSFLGILYKELMVLSRSLYSEGVDEIERQLSIKSRPKVLHARSYEEGMKIFNRHRRNVMALICDVGIPRGGTIDSEGGFKAVEEVRKYNAELPVLLQSAKAENQARALAMKAGFLHKYSPSLLADLRRFLLRDLGFGPFIFTHQDGEEVGRAADLLELETRLPTIPDEVFEYHAAHNHFSIWFLARSEFNLCRRLRKKRIQDFPSLQAVRQYIIDSLKERRLKKAKGVVTDFRRDRFLNHPFTRLGQGALGGKARGLAFLYRRLAMTSKDEFSGLALEIPKTVVVTTDYFDQFIEMNDLREFAFECKDDAEVLRRFIAAELPHELGRDLAFISDQWKNPIAVRSSSLLEDSMHQRLAGIYHTQMIPNRNPDPSVRHREIADAVKMIYASAFMQNAKSYLGQTGHLVEEEKMAIIIQKLVGRYHGKRYYPSFAGVAQSYNYYPIGPQRSEDGVVHVALGLGRMIVAGGKAFRFSPKHPAVLPQVASTAALLKNSQTEFWALNLDAQFQPGNGWSETLSQFDLEAAELDGSLDPVASIYSANDQRIRDDLTLPGPRIITFNNILKHKAIPLADAIERLLDIAKQGLGGAVEIEFAVEMGDWGRNVSPGKTRREPKLSVLQIRPFTPRTYGDAVAFSEIPREDILCESHLSLGQGLIPEIRDVVYVCRDSWSVEKNRDIVREVDEFNRQLVESGRPYLLIGPGRWGSADPWLGIPVQWSNIAGVRAIVEAALPGYEVEPSQGTHFFQNITSLEIGYLTVAVSQSSNRPADFLDWDWLHRFPLMKSSPHLRWIRSDKPLTVLLDGRKRKGCILKPDGHLNSD